MGTGDVVVTVPVSGVGLHEAYSFFNKASGEKALAPEVIGVCIANAIVVEGGLLLFLEIDEAGNFRLHAVGEFVGSHTSTEIATIRAVLEVGVIELGEKIKVGALPSFGHSLWTVEIKNGASGGAERGALEVGGKEAVGPIASPSLRIRGAWQHDEPGKVFVERAKTVGHPCSNAGISSKLVSGVELVAGSGVVDRVDLCAAIKTDVIDHFLEMNPWG